MYAVKLFFFIFKGQTYLNRTYIEAKIRDQSKRRNERMAQRVLCSVNKTVSQYGLVALMNCQVSLLKEMSVCISECKMNSFPTNPRDL